MDVLRKESCSDLMVIKIDPELVYADYMVVTTCRSKRHLTATGELINKLIKLKKAPDERMPKMEGLKKHEGWVALDLGTLIRDIFWEKSVIM